MLDSCCATYYPLSLILHFAVAPPSDTLSYLRSHIGYVYITTSAVQVSTVYKQTLIYFNKTQYHDRQRTKPANHQIVVFICTHFPHVLYNNLYF